MRKRHAAIILALIAGIVGVNRLTQPKGITVYPKPPVFFELAWAGPPPESDHVTGNLIYMGTESGRYFSPVLIPNVTTVKVLNHPFPVYCAVSAVNAYGEGAMSDEVVHFPP